VQESEKESERLSGVVLVRARNFAVKKEDEKKELKPIKCTSSRLS